MKCYICNEDFNIKRNIINLFKDEKYLICPKCYEKYKMKINFSIIPMDYNELVICSLFDIDYKINFNSFIFEYSKIYKYLLKKYNGYTIFLMDKFYVNEYNIRLYKNISKIEDKIVILVYYLQN